MKKVKLKKFLWENKEGTLIGLGVGYVVARFFLPSSFDFSMVQQTYGLIDVIGGATTQTIEFAKTKVTVGFMIVCGVIGMFVDIHLKEKWYKKWF